MIANKIIINNGYGIHEKDFRKNEISSKNGTHSNDKFNFVGFLVNNNDDVFTVFPKKYLVDDWEFDSRMIFNLIYKHIQRSRYVRW